LEEDIFISQESYAKEVFKKFKMFDCYCMNTPIESEIKLSKFEDSEKENPTLLKSLIEV